MPLFKIMIFDTSQPPCGWKNNNTATEHLQPTQLSMGNWEFPVHVRVSNLAVCERRRGVEGGQQWSGQVGEVV